MNALNTSTPLQDLFGKLKVKILMQELLTSEQLRQIDAEILRELKTREALMVVLEVLRKVHEAVNIGDAYQREDHLDNLKPEIRRALSQTEGKP